MQLVDEIVPYHMTHNAGGQGRKWACKGGAWEAWREAGQAGRPCAQRLPPPAWRALRGGAAAELGCRAASPATEAGCPSAPRCANVRATPLPAHLPACLQSLRLWTCCWRWSASGSWRSMPTTKTTRAPASTCWVGCRGGTGMRAWWHRVAVAGWPWLCTAVHAALGRRAAQLGLCRRLAGALPCPATPQAATTTCRSRRTALCCAPRTTYTQRWGGVGWGGWLDACAVRRLQVGGGLCGVGLAAAQGQACCLHRPTSLSHARVQVGKHSDALRMALKLGSREMAEGAFGACAGGWVGACCLQGLGGVGAGRGAAGAAAPAAWTARLAVASCATPCNTCHHHHHTFTHAC